MRPKHLADYNNPPLDEVVLGVQFSRVQNYTSVDSHAVWELFKADFPKVTEQPIIDTQFETFGGVHMQQPSFQLQFGGAPLGSRLFFISNDESHLLQFQPDCFILNWRKSPNPQPYPRFEGVSDIFKKNLQALERFFDNKFNTQVEINQVEISYINIIPVEEFANVSKWFEFLNMEKVDLEGLSMSFGEVIVDNEGQPFARLKHDLQSAYSADGQQKAYRLSLSYRGKPSENNSESALEFLSKGREAIVKRFDEITSQEAHEHWERKDAS